MSSAARISSRTRGEARPSAGPQAQDGARATVGGRRRGDASPSCDDDGGAGAARLPTRGAMLATSGCPLSTSSTARRSAPVPLPWMMRTDPSPGQEGVVEDTFLGARPHRSFFRSGGARPPRCSSALDPRVARARRRRLPASGRGAGLHGDLHRHRSGPHVTWSIAPSTYLAPSRPRWATRRDRPAQRPGSRLGRGTG